MTHLSVVELRPHMLDRFMHEPTIHVPIAKVMVRSYELMVLMSRSGSRVHQSFHSIIHKWEV